MKQTLYSLFATLLLLPVQVFAVGPEDLDSVNYTNLKPEIVKSSTGVELLGNLVRTFIGLLGFIAFVMFIYAGFKWMMAGTSDDTTKSKNMMKNTAIGMFVILISYSLATLIFNVISGATGR